ncbi:MAG: hypothetical protein A2297_00435 [Elusimicrobia bacterium RIFOXYB2_FULL_48_7]|nr:MAG: hypothetical protein A2297_00435 [Elusimicrobia bacterium RIFOXYB2_FULL_48_7]
MEVLKVKDLKKEDVPKEMRVESYFDLKAHPFKHEALLTGEGVNSVVSVIGKIGSYSKKWIADTISENLKKNPVLKVQKSFDKINTHGHFEVILEEGAVFSPSCIFGSKDAGKAGKLYVSKNAVVFGSDIYLDEGDIFIDEGAVIEASAGLKGPTIIGKKTSVREGAYLRGNVIIGDGAVIRGELKNVLILDKGNFPHPSYLGDSICGYMSHFGNQVTAANLGIYEGLKDADKRTNLVFRLGGKSYDIGTPKMGVVAGDFCQIGCSSTTDPGTFLMPHTISYTLTRISKGFYGPNEILKNKALEKGIIERSPFNPNK